MSLWELLKRVFADRGTQVSIEETLPTFYTNPKGAEPVDVIPSQDYTTILKRRNRLFHSICLAFDRAIPRLVKNDDGTVKRVPGEYEAVIVNGKIQSTFCNCFSNDVATAMGCLDFYDATAKRPKMANEIFDFLVKSKDWTEIEMKDAQDFANQGYLVVAAEKSPTGHGHICIVRPGFVQDSHRWVTVPSVANVGQDNYIGRGLNWAFSELPKFFLWRAGI